MYQQTKASFLYLCLPLVKYPFSLPARDLAQRRGGLFYLLLSVEASEVTIWHIEPG